MLHKENTMPIDPRLQPLLAAGPQPQPSTDEEAGETRATAHAIAEQLLPMLIDCGPRMASVTDEALPVDGGQIQVRIYRPIDVRPLPVCIYFHGGGWWQGNLTLVDPECRYMANASECLVVSVAYRLAPEHRFPIPLEDCYSTLCWVAEHADRLGVDPHRIAVAGGSAGGNLAAAVALLARDRGGPRLAGQVLVVPATDLTWSHQSIEDFGRGYELTKEQLEYCARAYVGPDGDARNPLISPMYADLHDLPPALIVTAECDPLRDEGEAYGRRLQEAGVPTIIDRVPGMLHGSFALNKLVPDVAERYEREVADFLSSILRNGQVPAGATAD
jgi:acetyl esterase